MVSAQVAAVAVQWAQCENVNCQKWRRLPPGTAVDENAPWYCYMNPDPEHNTCSADEAEYDEENEVIITEDANQAAQIQQQLAEELASRAAKGKGSKLQWKQQQRGTQASRAGSRALTPGVESENELVVEDENEEEEVIPRMNWRQLSRRLIQLVGTVGGAAEASGQPPALAPEVWQELRRRCPDGAEAAVQAVDVASAARCFGSGKQAEESAALACLSIALVAARILVDNRTSLTVEEQSRLGLNELSDDASAQEILAGILPLDEGQAPALSLWRQQEAASVE